MANVTTATITAWLRQRPKQGQRHIHRAASGLDLYVYADGPGAWHWRGQPRGNRPDGKRWPMQRIKLGDTATHTLSQAITEAARLKNQINRGGDPAGERRAAIEARREAAAIAAARSTCRELMVLYAAAIGIRGVTASHVQDEASQIRHGLETVGLLDVSPDAVTVEATEDMMARCPVKSRATRFAAIHRFLTWALRRSRTGAVPPTALFARHERPKPNPPRTRVLTPDELRRIWTAAEMLEGVEGDLLKFLVSVPCRRGEAALMQWRDVDCAAGVWSQPTSKNKLPHVFYLPELALEVLQRRRRAGGMAPESDGLAFPGVTTGRVFSTWSHLKRRADAKLRHVGESITDWTLHDLRRSFTTIAAEQLGADDTLLDLTLNHSHARTRSRITGTYNLSERRDARIRLMRDWNRLLTKIIRGETATLDAEVVNLPLRAVV
jgi:integrase